MESGFSSIVALWKDLVGCSEPKVAKMQREMSNRGNGLTDGLVRSLGGKKKYIYTTAISVCAAEAFLTLSVTPTKTSFLFLPFSWSRETLKVPHNDSCRFLMVT